MNPWIEAMRLRTLPVSVSGVVTALALAALDGTVRWLPWCICLVFAVTAQIASNFANEYYDYAAGRDRPGRQGPRRGVTEGDISPLAMKTATLVTLAGACCLGMSLLVWAPWWYIPAGILIAVGVMAYSTGPFPLSAKGLGEVAVVFFFGIIPVNLTYYLMAGQWTTNVLLASVAIGLLGANVLIVNNYRDADDDRTVGKRTLAVRLGRKWMPWLYGLNAVAAMVLLIPEFAVSPWGSVVQAFLTSMLVFIASDMCRKKGAALTPLLGRTALVMLATSLYLAVCAIF